jgi:hypothetical protein
MLGYAEVSFSGSFWTVIAAIGIGIGFAAA